MKKRNVVILITLSLIILIFSYFKYLKKDKIIEVIDPDSEIINYNSNIIKEVYYSSKDPKGNEYIIKASQGEIDYKQTEIIFLTEVIAIIKLTNSNSIKISSKYGKYNSNNLDTIFSKDVVISYLESKITSDYLESSLQKNSMIISKNVIYENLGNTLKADVIEMNLDTKDIKIFMYKDNEKVNIRSNQ